MLTIQIVKLRGSQHSKELKLYEITREGLVMVTGLSGYEGRMTGRTTRLGDSTQHERLRMTNEPNPEDSRRAQTEDDHGLVDANAPLTLSARRHRNTRTNRIDALSASMKRTSPY